MDRRKDFPQAGMPRNTHPLRHQRGFRHFAPPRTWVQVFWESYNVNDWLVKSDSCTNCQGNQPRSVETENLGNLKCMNDHLEAKKPLSTP